MVITFPFVLLLLDYWPFGRFEPPRTQFSSFLTLALEKWPFFLLSALSALATYLVHLQGSSLASPIYFPLSVRLANVPVSYCRYLWKMFYPVDLCPFYIHPRKWPVSVIASTTLLLIVASIGALRLRLRARYLFVGWIWFLITLLPVIGIIQAGSQSIADRYTYLPYIGLFIAVCWLIPDFLPHFGGRDLLLRSASVAILVTLPLLTQRQVAYWKSSETLFQHAVSVEPNNTLAHANLGADLMQSGHLVEAEQHLREALRLAGEAADKMAGVHLALGMLFTDEGRYAEAIVNYQKAVARHPDDAKAHLLLGIALHRIDASDAAIEEFHTAAKLQPDLAEAYNNLGMIYREQGKLDLAIQSYRTALSLRPGFADAHNNLAITLSLQDRPHEAIAEFERAIELDQSSPAFHTNLGAQLEQLHHPEEAIAEYRQALRLAPGYSEAKEKLNQLLTKTGNGGSSEPK
jgi:Flp pilus assembly protein TadD